MSGKIRKCTDSAPVGGRPRDFPVRDIDFAMIIAYQKIRPVGRWKLPHWP